MVNLKEKNYDINSRFKTFIQISNLLSLPQKKSYNFLLYITKVQIEKLESQGKKVNYNN